MGANGEPIATKPARCMLNKRGWEPAQYEMTAAAPLQNFPHQLFIYVGRSVHSAPGVVADRERRMSLVVLVILGDSKKAMEVAIGGHEHSRDHAVIGDPGEANSEIGGVCRKAAQVLWNPG